MQAQKKKKALQNCKAFNLLAPRPGLEPGTYGLTENSFTKLCLFYEGYKQ
jgi:hypothetical protein